MSGTIPTPPANVAVYVDVLGADLAIEFLLKFGGAEIYMPSDPKGRSEVAKLVGIRKARALAQSSLAMKQRVPTPRRWLAQAMAAKGLPVAEIARRLHVSDVMVRRHIKAGPGAVSDDRQLPLF